MVYNLLDNAIKYNKPGGRASITITAQEGQVILRVSDTGIGIPKGEQARVFERFYRVEKSHNRAIEGTGLGLAIVKHGALLHGAELRLESDSNGTSFTIRFPTQM
jgi:two-component system phosphate regulon sensor histidine kinase PhoR